MQYKQSKHKSLLKKTEWKVKAVIYLRELREEKK
jgi:hypothetical protein